MCLAALRAGADAEDRRDQRRAGLGWHETGTHESRSWTDQAEAESEAALMPYTADVPWATGSPTSFEAALAAKKFVSRQGLEVYRWLVWRGPNGGTQKEAVDQVPGLSRPSACARFKALEDDKAIRKTSMRRAGCAAYVVAGPHTQQPALRFEER
jgi:hypothetical protein